MGRDLVSPCEAPQEAGLGRVVGVPRWQSPWIQGEWEAQPHLGMGLKSQPGLAPGVLALSCP